MNLPDVECALGRETIVVAEARDRHDAPAVVDDVGVFVVNAAGQCVTCDEVCDHKRRLDRRHNVGRRPRRCDVGDVRRREGAGRLGVEAVRFGVEEVGGVREGDGVRRFRLSRPRDDLLAIGGRPLAEENRDRRARRELCRPVAVVLIGERALDVPSPRLRRQVDCGAILHRRAVEVVLLRREGAEDVQRAGAFAVVLVVARGVVADGP